MVERVAAAFDLPPDHFREYREWQVVETIRGNASLCDELHRSIGRGRPRLPSVPRLAPPRLLETRAVGPNALGARVRDVARARRAGNREALQHALQALAQVAQAWAGQLASEREPRLTSRTAA